MGNPLLIAVRQTVAGCRDTPSQLAMRTLRVLSDVSCELSTGAEGKMIRGWWRKLIELRPMRRGLSVAECILSRADLYQSRIIEPNVAISADRMAETISPVTIALLLMPWAALWRTQV
jgi:hypothetical protein